MGLFACPMMRPAVGNNARTQLWEFCISFMASLSAEAMPPQIVVVKPRFSIEFRRPRFKYCRVSRKTFAQVRQKMAHAVRLNTPNPDGFPVGKPPVTWNKTRRDRVQDFSEESGIRRSGTEAFPVFTCIAHACPIRLHSVQP